MQRTCGGKVRKTICWKQFSVKILCLSISSFYSDTEHQPKTAKIRQHFSIEAQAQILISAHIVVSVCSVCAAVQSKLEPVSNNFALQ